MVCKKYPSFQYHYVLYAKFRRDSYCLLVSYVSENIQCNKNKKKCEIDETKNINTLLENNPFI